MSQFEKKTYYTLSTILKGVKQHLEERIKDKKFWLKAEISNISFHRHGHCYMDLLETKNGDTIAQIKASIWNHNIQNIQSALGDDFKNVLKVGSEVLLYSELTYSEIYGLQINIREVDKSFSLGELERKKQETLNRLKNENLLDKNKEHKVPIVIQNIALLGSPNTSGHTDFLKQIRKNEYGFEFIIDEYHCQVQGEKAEVEIINKLNEIRNIKYDVVVIVRGGGSKLDLEVFNSYSIAKEIANFPLPVFTGIGHETDMSIIDFIANRNFKTPSAVGSFIIDKAYQYYVRVTSIYNFIMENYNKSMLTLKKDLFANTQFLNEKALGITRLKRGDLHTYSNRLISNVRERLNQENSSLKLNIDNISSISKFNINENRRNINEYNGLIELFVTQKISSENQNIEQSIQLTHLLITNKIKKEKNWIENIEDIPTLFHPDNILKKGYALVRLNNLVITKETQVRVGDIIEIEFIDKKILATVTKNTKKWNNLITKLLQRN